MTKPREVPLTDDDVAYIQRWHLELRMLGAYHVELEAYYRWARETKALGEHWRDHLDDYLQRERNERVTPPEPFCSGS